MAVSASGAFKASRASTTGQSWGQAQAVVRYSRSTRGADGPSVSFPRFGTPKDLAAPAPSRRTLDRSLFIPASGPFIKGHGGSPRFQILAASIVINGRVKGGVSAPVSEPLVVILEPPRGCGFTAVGDLRPANGLPSARFGGLFKGAPQGAQSILVFSFLILNGRGRPQRWRYERPLGFSPCLRAMRDPFYGPPLDGPRRCVFSQSGPTVGGCLVITHSSI